MVKARSMRSARMTSFAFRAIDTSLVSRKFFATCWVMVDAPIGRRLLPMRLIFVAIALAMPGISIPGWV